MKIGDTVRVKGQVMTGTVRSIVEGNFSNGEIPMVRVLWNNQLGRTESRVTKSKLDVVNTTGIATNS